MNMEVVGFIAAILTTFAYLPQVLQILKTRDTEAISLPMYIVMNAGIFCWLSYGIHLMSWPIILANIVTMTMSLPILYMKARDARRSRDKAL